MKIYVKGFTVIEVVVAMVIVSIMAAIAYPSYVSQLRKSRRAEATTQLVSLPGWTCIGYRHGDGYAWGWWHHRLGRSQQVYSADQPRRIR